MSLTSIVVLVTFTSPCTMATDKTGALVLNVTRLAAGTIPDSNLLDPHNHIWNSIPDNPLHFNRTGPLFDGDPLDGGERPAADIRLCRLNDRLVIRVHWTDSTEDKTSDVPRYPDGGDAHIYHRHSNAVDEFHDAFCVMIPITRGPTQSYPSLMMGSIDTPVELYYWKGGSGFKILNAHGRASTSETGTMFKGVAQYGNSNYIVTMILTNVPPKTPVCFAIWDGAKQQRDGMKYFSLWYEVE